MTHPTCTHGWWREGCPQCRDFLDWDGNTGRSYIAPPKICGHGWLASSCGECRREEPTKVEERKLCEHGWYVENCGKCCREGQEPPKAESKDRFGEGESILEEAQRLTHGDRNHSYGHPLDDYTKTAGFWTVALQGAGVLKVGAEITPELAGLMMALMKISRQLNAPKRDNMTDLAGYAWCVHVMEIERARRKLERTIVEGAQKIMDSMP